MTFINKEVVAAPSIYFNSPLHLVKSKELSIHEKGVALMNWKNQVFQLMNSESEGMKTVQKSTTIEEIDSALNVIDQIS